MLFADAICSSKEFTESFRREMKALFPEQPLERIPPSDPMFTSRVRRLRPDAASRAASRSAAPPTGPLKSHVRKGEPYLEGLKLGDRYAVIFSPYDLSCALENHESLECDGYTREDAARIGAERAAVFVASVAVGATECIGPRGRLCEISSTWQPPRHRPTSNRADRSSSGCRPDRSC